MELQGRWPAPARIRVASYNIHQCVGRDGCRDADRIAAVLREIDADIVGLQEVDSDPAGFRDSRQMDYIASMTGYEAVAGFNIRDEDRHYGNALLSRFPVQAVQRHDLSVAGLEPRGAIDAEVHVLEGRLRVVVTHLGLRLRERRAQSQRLLRALRPSALPLLLLGDLNEWLPALGVLGEFRRFFGRAPSPASFPAHRPLLALDRIFCSPPGRICAMQSHRSALTLQASDHLPVVAELEA